MQLENQLSGIVLCSWQGLSYTLIETPQSMLRCYDGDYTMYSQTIFCIFCARIFELILKFLFAYM